MADRDRAPVRIFMCYRRSEVAWPANWLYDLLREHFSSSDIFKDVDSIELGDDFVASITAAVESCDVLLALIGPGWLTLEDESGKRRLDDPDDFVRIEIQTALRREIRVIPVLVDGAVMPSAKALPRSLQQLARRQALELTPARFRQDAARLIKVLEKSITQSQASQQSGLESAATATRDAKPLARYKRTISRSNPGGVVIMVDQSAEMGQRFADGGSTLADEAAKLANEMLQELCLMSRAGRLPRAGHFFDAVALGYGSRPDDSAEPIERLLPVGARLNLSSISAIADSFRDVDIRQVGEKKVRVPRWIEPEYGHGRPTCRAIAEVGQYVYEWAKEHTDSFPPLIINITCGLATDSPYEDASLQTWAERLSGILTLHGETLLANILLSPGKQKETVFLSSAAGLVSPARELFAISSLVPAGLAAGLIKHPNSRMMGINKGKELLRIFELG